MKIYIILAALTLLVGCEKTDLSEIESKIKKEVSEYAIPKNIDIDSYNEIRVVVLELFKKLKKSDMSELKEKVTRLDTYVSTRVWLWYFNVTEEKNKNGVSSSLLLIDDLLATKNIEPHELEALNEIKEKYSDDTEQFNDDLFWQISYHSLRPKYGDEGATAIMLTLAAAQIATRL